MVCEYCGGKGFVEYEHGLIQVQCTKCYVPLVGEVSNDNSLNGIELDNTITRSGDTGQPKRTQKPKAKRKARAKSS